MIPEIKIKVTIESTTELIKIINSKDAYNFALKLFNADTIQWREEMIMICLNRGNMVVGYYKLSSGGTSATTVDPKIIFTVALQSIASGIMLFHNHPTSNIEPSEIDKATTKRIAKCGDILDIKLLDHIIVGTDNFFSFADNGIIDLR